MENEEKFYDLGEDTIELIDSIIDNMALPFNIRIKYMGNAKMKNLIKLQKMSDAMAHITKIDLVIFINEDYLISLEDDNAKILVHQELDRLEFDINKGKFKLAKFPLQTTEGVLIKYGIEAVARANKLSDLYTEQLGDKDAENNFDQKNVETRKINKVEFLDDED